MTTVTPSTHIHGSEQRAYAGGYDLSRFFRELSTDEQVADADRTAFVDRARRSQPGKREDSASGGGMLATDPIQASQVLEAALGAEGSIVVSFPRDEVGFVGWAMPAWLAQWATNYPQDDIVDLTVEWKAEDQARHPVCLVDGARRTDTFEAAQVDLGEGTHSVELVAQLVGVDGFTGVELKVQHRASEVDAWSDVVALTTDPLDEHDFDILTASNVERYVRGVATPTGASGSFEASMALSTLTTTPPE